MYKIPLSNYPNQTFTCNVPVNGENKNFRFELWYNYDAKYWLLSLFDINSNSYLVSNLPLLVTYGEWANMFYQIDYMKIGICFIVPSESGRTDNPDDTNLGTSYLMIWGDNNE